jgi:hypothetical protein
LLAVWRLCRHPPLLPPLLLLVPQSLLLELLRKARRARQLLPGGRRLPERMPLCCTPLRAAQWG